MAKSFKTLRVINNSMFWTQTLITVCSTLGIFVALCIAPPIADVSAEEPAETDSKEFRKKLDEFKKSFQRSPDVLKEINRLEKKYPEQSGAPKYDQSGHKYTTYIVAMAAGLGSLRSYKLSYFSQYPDDEIRFSATLAFFDLDWERRKQVMAVLHSLHGGDRNAVLKRRSDLRDLIVTGLKNKEGKRWLDDYQIGLIIHAFADSYAHTAGEGSDLKAFNFTWGHLFHGHKPDIIAYSPDKYKDYTCELYKALSLKSSCSTPEINDLHAMIDKLKMSRNAELPEFEKYARNPFFGFKGSIYNAKSKEWSQLKTGDVVDTIRIMEKETSH